MAAATLAPLTAWFLLAVTKTHEMSVRFPRHTHHGFTTTLRNVTSHELRTSHVDLSLAR